MTIVVITKSMTQIKYNKSYFKLFPFRYKLNETDYIFVSSGKPKVVKKTDLSFELSKLLKEKSYFDWLLYSIDCYNERIDKIDNLCITKVKLAFFLHLYCNNNYFA